MDLAEAPSPETPAGSGDDSGSVWQTALDHFGRRHWPGRAGRAVRMVQKRGTNAG